MEFDNDDVAERLAISMNDLLEVSIKKLGRILTDILEGSSMTCQDANDLLDVHDQCYQLACKVDNWHERKYPTVVPWLPEDRSQLKNMAVLSCKSPWSVFLTYPKLNLDLLKNYTEDSLTKFVGTPPVGSFLCVTFRKRLFRAVLIEVLSQSRLKVMNIDTNEVFIIPTTSIYHMPPEASSIHALSMHCCLIEQDEVIEKLWSEVEEIFTRALKECSVRVEIVKTVCEKPPKYLVDLTGTNSDGRTVNLTKWLNNTLIPDMKQSFPHLINKEEVLYFLKDESIDPFGVALLDTTSSLCSESEEQIMSNLCAVPPPVEGVSSSSANSTVGHSVTNDEYNNENLSALSSTGSHSGSKSDKPCGNANCLKKHDSTSVQEIHDSPPNPQSLVSLTQNKISLPQVGDRVNVVITHILTSLSFYVLLEEKYSEFIAQNGAERYMTLFNRMNHTLGNYVTCSTPPSNGQLVAYRSSSWMRGILMETCSCSAKLLNPDLGRTEVVPAWHLGSIAQEDSVLPFQAVLTFLHNVKCSETNHENALNYFMRLTSSGKLHVIVKAVDHERSIIEVELFTSDELNINEALVESGFCAKVFPGSP